MGECSRAMVECSREKVEQLYSVVQSSKAKESHGRV